RDELQRELVVDVGDRKHFVEHALQTDVGLLLPVAPVAQQGLERLDLDVEHVRHLHCRRQLREADDRETADAPVSAVLPVHLGSQNGYPSSGREARETSTETPGRLPGGGDADADQTVGVARLEHVRSRRAEAGLPAAEPFRPASPSRDTDSACAPVRSYAVPIAAIGTASMRNYFSSTVAPCSSSF